MTLVHINVYTDQISTLHLHILKAANKTVFIKKISWQANWIIKLLVKCRSKLVSVISFVVPITTRQLATWFLYLSSCVYQGDTCKKLASLADSCITHWFELFYKSHLYYIANISITLPKKYVYSSYFMSLPESTYLDC